MIVVGETGLVRWSCIRGDIGPEELATFVAHIRGTRFRPGLVMVDIAHDIAPPSAADRRQIADAVGDSLNAGLTLACHVVVSNSLVARGVLTAVNWIVKTPFPEHVSSSPTAGLVWAKQHSADVDVDATLQAIGREVPWFSSLRW